MKNEEIELKLTALYMEWEYVKEHGTSSTIWTDGQELNYIRKQITMYKDGIVPEENLPGIYFHELPPVMKRDYVKDAENIYTAAQKALKMYLEDANYKYLRDVHGCIVHSSVVKNGREWELICRPLEDVLFEIEKFRSAVNNKNYVFMKRYLDVAKVLEKLKNCRAELEQEIEDIVPFD